MTAFSVLTPPQANATTTQFIHAGKGVSQALTLANIVKAHSGVTLLVTHDTPSAIQLESELKYLLSVNKVKVCLFPDRETLPYDSFSPHQDLVSQRLATLSQLNTMGHGVLIVPITTLMVRLPPLNFMAGNVLMLKKGDTYDLHKVRQQLTDTSTIIMLSRFMSTVSLRFVALLWIFSPVDQIAHCVLSCLTMKLRLFATSM